VRQIESNAIKKIQHHTRACFLLPFVEIKECVGKPSVSDKRLKQIAKTNAGKALLAELFK
jgi:hypothetical protein